jgi:DNA-directed RNA polymerase
MIRPWTSSSPIVIHDAISVPPVVLRKNRLGIGGDGAELLSNLHTCLSVGRFSRAESIIRRLAQLFNPIASELRVAHNLYLRSLLDSLMLGREHVSLKKIQQWFEVEVRNEGVSPDSTTFAIMCRAAMVTLSGNTRDRTVRRYLHMAEEAGLLEDTLSSGEFHDAEWEELFRLRDDLFSQPELEATMAEFAIPEEILSAPLAASQYQPIDLEVKPVEQKGLGLKSLKESLSSLHSFDATAYPPAADANVEGSQEERDRAMLYARQEHIEEAVVDSTIARWKEEHAQMLQMGINSNLQARSLGAMMWEWHTTLESTIKKEVKEIQELLDTAESQERQDVDSRIELGPYLEAVRPEKMAAITILTVCQYLAAEGAIVGMTLSRLTARLGRHLEAECSVRSHVSRKRHEDRVKSAHRRSLFLTRLTEHSGKAEAGAGAGLMEGTRGVPDVHDRWPLQIRHRIAALLLAKLIDKAKISVKGDSDKRRGNSQRKEFAFRHSVDSLKGKRVGMIYAHKELVEFMGKVPSRSSLGLSGHLPMLVEPLPWTGYRQGGYLRYPANFMRSKGTDPVQEMYAVAAIEKGDMDQVFAGLNVLGKTAWRVNTPVLKVMVEAWNSGEAVADIPPSNPEIAYPPEPDSSADGRTRYAWKQRIQELENEKMGLHSQRCFQNLQLEVAKTFANETFYYPHNIDFRGRAYPIPAFLNHMGADGSRGLLQFAKGKALGPTGLSWLKIHLANVFGNNKSTLSEREQFATDHLDDIYDSVAHPLTGKRWWLTAEDPWQSLACCFEIKSALDSGDSATFISHLAVHQDGTCNGLQHYAALGGDKLGAAQVNLEPGDRPADIYSGVADLVRSSIEADAEEGDPMAKVLRHKITRKVVKQTVMTNVYGVTFIGARAQVQRQLDDIMVNRSESDIENHHLASYIAKKIFKALAAMFQGAHAIQYWLGECADRISTTVTPEQLALIKAKKDGNTAADPQYRKSALTSVNPSKHSLVTDFKSSVVWTTPLKLPVVQPYRAQKKREIQTAMQNITLREHKPGDPVSKRKQLQAFPPNFVHSLDATHMLLSALKCDELGLTFAAVHDSFWTHAADVPIMNQVLRDSFVRMHEEDIIGRLAAEFSVRYKDSIRLTSVYAQSPVGKRIYAHRKSNGGKLHSRSRRVGGAFTDELLEEWERQKLLKSDDPEKVMRGKAMVTPASIFETIEDSSQFQPPVEELEALKLGAIPDDAALEEALNEKMPDFEEADDRSDVRGAVKAEAEDSGMEQKLAAKKKKKDSNTRKAETKLLIWVPLSFPEVPKKGDFDVSRLRDSTYFFS